MNTHNHRHRSAHPDDRILFFGQHLLTLKKAVDELCWLFNRGYSRHSAIKLVGDHHQLRQRQRIAIGRVACSVDCINNKRNKCLSLSDIKNRHLIIDGFNLVITLESAMSRAVLLRCCDGCIRDLASVHGTYRLVSETNAVIELVGRTLSTFQLASVQWLFDRPVSNSGKLAKLVRSTAKAYDWNWQAELLDNPDSVIKSSNMIAITSDSVILDAVGEWVNLMSYLLEYCFQEAWVIDFS